MRKIILSFILLISLFAAGQATAAQPVNLYFFRGDGCPHCAAEEVFLAKLKVKYPDLTVRDFEVWYNKDNAKLLQKFGDRLGAKVSGVPFTVVGDKYIVGYGEDETTGKQLEELVSAASKYGVTDVGAQILDEQAAGTDTAAAATTTASSTHQIPETIKVPILGELNIKKMSLPVLTVVLGLLDGFNPCSMWALIFLISLLISFGDKKRLLILGSTFIITSAASYFLFMAAWLNLFLFIGFIFWIRLAIGLVALGSGYFNLKEYRDNKNAVCKVSTNTVTQSFIGKLKNAVYHEKLWLAFFGVIALAFAINMVELVCSVGFPAVYTQVLSLSGLPTWQYYAYILGYVFFYDLDEIIVLILALSTFKITTASAKYTLWAQLIGGILMIILGLLLIFKPAWLMFG